MTRRASPFVLIFLAGFFCAFLLVASFGLGFFVALKDPKLFSFSEAPSSVPKQENSGAVSDPSNNQPLKEAEAPKEPEIPTTAEGKFAKSFENLLNQFLKDLSTETSVYKKDRRILKEVISPYNVEGTENAEKSYKTFKEDVAPTLRRKGQKIIDVFKNSDVAITALLSDQPERVRASLMSTWEDMKKKQLDGVIDFLANEERLISAHERLLKFYFVHSKLYNVDQEKGKIVFKSSKYQEEEQQILNEIEKLRSYGKKQD